MNRLVLFLLLPMLALVACKSSKKLSDDVQPDQVYNFDTLVIMPPPSRPVYRAAEDQEVDLLHTKLEVRFDWEKQHLIGKAEVTLLPYFYPISKVVLDAQKFDFKQIALLGDTSKTDLEYRYNGKQVMIDLPKAYTRKDTFTLWIDYTARPNEKEVNSGSAIAEDKGLYFINPLGDQPNKPQQIWTQGEPESNSGWFPTVDAPNQRMTQEVFITVDEKYTTLSNGALVFQSLNGDGTRTDYWKQALPHAPYLTMMAIGKFEIVKDEWEEMEVNYYLEPSFAANGKAIFGATPEMIGFFSERLGVRYPWEKYHQVVVRDYVSGAMENTSAVIHGEFLYRTPRELLDDHNEDIIAHELFHHWFGDLVTCESWANLPLNESFATYGEYLWREYKHGRESADEHLQNDLSGYLYESRSKREDMIRFDYSSIDDMFDSHSYAKGGRILHMLRKELGDEAFFETMLAYLENNRYTAVEIHHLRLSSEEVTGKDLNWFFNQWFLSSGHPELEIAYEWDESAQVQRVKVTQKQNLDVTPLYRLPVAIDLYIDGQRQRHYRTLLEVEEELTFECSKQPDWINFDGEKRLLAVKTDLKSVDEWSLQYYHGPLFVDRREAILACGDSAKSDSAAAKMVLAALDDDYDGIRYFAMNQLEHVVPKFPVEVEAKLVRLSKTDPVARVRSRAIRQLNSYYELTRPLKRLFQECLEDPSYAVMSASFEAISRDDQKQVINLAEKLEQEEGIVLLLTLARYYSEKGNEDQAAFFKTLDAKTIGFNRINYCEYYAEFLYRDGVNEATRQTALSVFENQARHSGVWYMRYYGAKSMYRVRQFYEKRQQELQEQLAKEEVRGDDLLLISELQKELAFVASRIEDIKKRFEVLKAEEQDSRVTGWMD
ncbi:MAG: M1 family aminopeptidase [Salibacteraceae bacterium]